jgi:hypothetical protein
MHEKADWTHVEPIVDGLSVTAEEAAEMAEIIEGVIATWDDDNPPASDISMPWNLGDIDALLRAVAERDRYKAALERIESDDHYYHHPGFDMEAHRLNVHDDCYGCWALDVLRPSVPENGSSAPGGS